MTNAEEPPVGTAAKPFESERPVAGIRQRRLRIDRHAGIAEVDPLEGERFAWCLIGRHARLPPERHGVAHAVDRHRQSLELGHDVIKLVPITAVRVGGDHEQHLVAFAAIRQEFLDRFAHSRERERAVGRLLSDPAGQARRLREIVDRLGRSNRHIPREADDGNRKRIRRTAVGLGLVERLMAHRGDCLRRQPASARRGRRSVKNPNDERLFELERRQLPR